MKRLLLSLSMLVSLSSFAQGFGGGNIVVYRYGDGAAPLPTGTVVPVFLDEYTTAGTLVGTKTIPTTAVGANFALTGLAKVASNSTYQTEGMSTLSQDGKYITIFGYNQQPGNGIPTTSNGLVVGIVAADGSYNATTTLSNEPSIGLGAPRSAVIDGNNIWANGYQNGIQYTTLGASGSTRVSVNQNSPRTFTIFNNTLYAPIGSSSTLAQATPLPTTSINLGTISISSPTPTTNQAAFFNVGGRLRMYIVDDGASTGNLIRRYYMNDAGNAWVVDGTISTAATPLLKSIAGIMTTTATKTAIELYGTTWGSDGTGTEPSRLIRVVDSFVTATPKNAPTYTSPVTILATAPANTMFRSVTLAPQGSAAIGEFVLPLLLKSFNAGIDGNNAKVWWSTLNEVNVKEFVIEKSADGKVFERVGTQAARNTAAGGSYTFTDNAVAATAFYRLKMVDKDGSYTYSAVVKVTVSKTNNIKLAIAPNPVAGNTFNVSHAKAGKDAVIRLFSLEGRLLQTTKVQAGATQSVVFVSQLVKGNYVVEFVDASGKQTATLVKQ